MPVSSNNSTEPVTTNPDLLPASGYTAQQLQGYIMRQLGSPTWDVELTPAQIADLIQDALVYYSQWRPKIRYGSVKLIRGVSVYLRGTDVGFGIASVSFVEPNPVPTELFYGNLIDPAPLFRTGLDEYDTFLRWRKVWQRVTSVQPDWLYDEGEKALYIHNPIERFHCGVTCYAPWPSVQSLPAFGSQWVKEYALERSRYLLGEVTQKFSGAIPGPMKDLAMDSRKRDIATERIKRLEEKLFNAQELQPITID